MKLGQMNLYFGVLNVRGSGTYLKVKCGAVPILNYGMKKYA